MTMRVPLQKFWRLRPAALALDAALVVLAAVFMLPLYTVVVTAFKPLAEVVHGTMLALPRHWTADPIARAWGSACIGSVCDGLAHGIWTSVSITVPAACGSVLLGAVNGYALTRWKVRGAHAMFGLLMVANLMPYQVMLLPMAVTLRTLGLFGTAGGLVLVHVVYGMPYMTLLFRNFFGSIPEELIRAARLDGGRFWSIFRHLMLPMARPMLLVALVLQVTAVWNDYLFGLVFGGRAVPVTVMLDNLINNQTGEKDYSVNMAGVLLAILPMLLVYVFGARLFMRGIAIAPAGR
jgi:glucose/mannose transport system permease protein